MDNKTDLRSLTASHAVLPPVPLKPSFTSLPFFMIQSNFACLTRSRAMRRDATYFTLLIGVGNCEKSQRLYCGARSSLVKFLCLKQTIYKGVARARFGSIAVAIVD